MKEIKGWLNVLLAVLAAIFGVMQEVWLGTEPYFLPFFATAASYAVCFTFCAEIFKMVFKKGNEWNWNDLIFGGLCGILTAIAATAVCVF